MIQVLLKRTRDYRLVSINDNQKFEYRVEGYTSQGWKTLYSNSMRSPVEGEYDRLSTKSIPGPAPSNIINGTPYVDCGWCEMPVRLFDGEKQKITILIKWEETDEYLQGKLDLTLSVKTKMKPILVQKPGCFECWYRQQLKRLPGRNGWYNER